MYIIHLGMTTENYSLSHPHIRRTLNSKTVFWVRSSRPFSNTETQRGKIALSTEATLPLWLLMLKLEIGLRVPCHSQLVFVLNSCLGTFPSLVLTLSILFINIRGGKQQERAKSKGFYKFKCERISFSITHTPSVLDHMDTDGIQVSFCI